MGDLNYGQPIEMTYEVDDVDDFIQLEETQVKCVGSITKLECEDLITIKGYLHMETEHFTINLVRKEDVTHANTIFQFKPLVSQKYVVCTTSCGPKQKVDEISTCVGFPFRRGEDFVLRIFVGNDALYFNVNSVHYCKMLLYSLKMIGYNISIEVKGQGIILDSVSRCQILSYPGYTSTSMPNIPKYFESPTIEWKHPIMARLQESLTTGRQLIIKGRINILPRDFIINFQTTPWIYPAPDIVFHMSPRFHDQGMHQIAFNSWRKGTWGEEMKVYGTSLFPGNAFELKINCEDDCYSIWLEDKKVASFPFVMPPQCVRVVKIEGDVKIYKIHQTVINQCTQTEALLIDLF